MSARASTSAPQSGHVAGSGSPHVDCELASDSPGTRPPPSRLHVPGPGAACRSGAHGSMVNRAQLTVFLTVGRQHRMVKNAGRQRSRSFRRSPPEITAVSTRERGRSRWPPGPEGRDRLQGREYARNSAKIEHRSSNRSEGGTDPHGADDEIVVYMPVVGDDKRPTTGADRYRRSRHASPQKSAGAMCGERGSLRPGADALADLGIADRRHERPAGPDPRHPLHPGRRAAPSRRRAGASTSHRVARVDVGYLEGLGQPVVQGRNFTMGDLGEDRSAVIVNEGFVERVLEDRYPLGRRVRYWTPGPEPGPCARTVVSAPNPALSL